MPGKGFQALPLIHIIFRIILHFFVLFVSNFSLNLIDRLSFTHPHARTIKVPEASGGF